MICQQPQLFRSALLGAFLWLVGVSLGMAEKPNILLILSDDYGYGSAGCYGAAPKLVRTPNLDRLAREGCEPVIGNKQSRVIGYTF